MAFLARVGQHLLNRGSSSELSQTLSREQAQQLQSILYSDVLVPARNTQAASILFAGVLLDSAALVQARQLFVCLAAEHYALPTSAHLIGVKYNTLEAWREGGQARILRGEWREQSVAVKRLRYFRTSPVGQVERREFREIATWLQLSHPFILPLLGVDTTNFAGHAAMISPWCEHGNIEEYLFNGRRKDQRLRLLTEVAQALEYLHSQSIVHDDLHPKNILIDEHEHVRLSDYGLSGVVDASVPNSVTGGLAEYSGPEKIMGHSSQLMESDIFAFGCVCVQVYSGRSPYYHLRPYLRIVFGIVEGERPKRPSADECYGTPIPDRLWALLKRCWQQEPSARPLSSEVAKEMIAIIQDEGTLHHIVTPATPAPALHPTPSPPFVAVERPKLVARPSPRLHLRIPGLYTPLSPECSPIRHLQSPIRRVGSTHGIGAEPPTPRNPLPDRTVDESHNHERHAANVLRRRRQPPFRVDDSYFLILVFIFVFWWGSVNT